VVVAFSVVSVAVAACAEPGPASVLPPTPQSATAPTGAPGTEAAESATPRPAGQGSPTPVVLATPAGPGVEVVYERGGELWSLAVATREASLAAQGLQGSGTSDMGDPWALAPDGRYLAFIRNSQGQAVLALATLPGGRPQEVGRYAGRVDALHWSHSAAQVAFVVNRRDERTGDLLEESLRLYNVASGHEATLYQQTFTNPDTVRQEMWLEGWVPGDAALYVALATDRTGDPGTLYALDARGGEPRPISADYSLKGGQAISPVASRVLLRNRSLSGRASPLYMARAAADGSLSEVALLSPEDWIVGAVAWSPDGQRVVVERLEAEAHGTFSGHLWLLAPGGAAPRQLTADPSFREEQPVWTPDGSTIVFGRWLAAQPQPAGLWGWDSSTGEVAMLDEAGVRPQAASRAR